MNGIIDPGRRVVVLVTVFLDRIVIEKCHSKYHRYAKEPHLPVSGNAVEENLAQVALAAKLGEYGPGGATAAKLVINNVGSVDCDSQNVDNKENDLHYSLILDCVASLERKQLQRYAQHVEVAKRTNVKSQSSPRNCHHFGKSHILEMM